MKHINQGTMMKLFIFALSFFLLAACSTGVKKVEVSYDKSTQARIRVLKNGTIRFYPNQTCSSPTILGVGDKGFNASHSDDILNVTSVSVGMPTPANMRYKYVEHVVNANQNLTVDASYTDALAGGHITVSCAPIVGTFVPASGGDYEVGVSTDGDSCSLEIRKISLAGDEYKTERVSYTPSKRCGYVSVGN